MSRDAKSAEKLAKLAEAAVHDAETAQDLECRRDLRVMALKYRRLAEFSRTHPAARPPPKRDDRSDE